MEFRIKGKSRSFFWCRDFFLSATVQILKRGILCNRKELIYKKQDEQLKHRMSHAADDDTDHSSL